MADVDTKSGTYTVRAHASGRLGDPESTFTFWWGNDAKPTEYFDVSIEPNPAFFPHDAFGRNAQAIYRGALNASSAYGDSDTK
jgi:hypothetical protein